MATDKPTVPKGFQAFEPSGNDDENDIETIELEPGQTLEGIVLDVTEGEGDFGPWYRLKLKDDTHGLITYFAKDQAKRACAEERVQEGERIWIAMDTEKQSFTGRNGDKTEYYPTRVALPGGGD